MWPTSMARCCSVATRCLPVDAGGCSRGRRSRCWHRSTSSRRYPQRHGSIARMSTHARTYPLRVPRSRKTKQAKDGRPKSWPCAQQASRRCRLRSVMSGRLTHSCARAKRGCASMSRSRRASGAMHGPMPRHLPRCVVGRIIFVDAMRALLTNCSAIAGKSVAKASEIAIRGVVRITPEGACKCKSD